MSRNLKIFFITLILSLPVWWGMDFFQENLEMFLYQKEIATNPRILAALAQQEQLSRELEKMKPIRNKKEVPDLELETWSSISVLVDKQGKERILFQQEIDRKLPIASLTKLMTARVALKNYALSDEIIISRRAVQEEGDFGKLKIGEILTVEKLLYPLLMESSNDAAFSLAQDHPDMEMETFVSLMNREAENMRLDSTVFTNPSGLEPNYSTARDLVKLTKILISEEPLIWKILSLPRINLYQEDLVNTNQLLNYEGTAWWRGKIIGGKTGYTEESGGCFLFVVKAPKNRGYLVNVVLGSKDRFNDMEKLLNWLKTAYLW